VVLRRTIEQFETYLARRASEPEEWLDAAEASYGRMWLTAEEAKQIGREFVEFAEKYRGRRASGKRPPGARHMRLAIMLFPSDESEPASGDT
jgi:hypothetical protein